jgi:two-component system KDP operon response regulator KdpE
VANLVDNALIHGGWGPGRGRGGGRPGGHPGHRPGPGHPPEDRERVFRPFQRLGDSANRVGVGLGLAVARGFVEAVGGELDVEDTPGGGCTMVIRSARVDAEAVDHRRRRPRPPVGRPPTDSDGAAAQDDPTDASGPVRDAAPSEGPNRGSGPGPTAEDARVLVSTTTPSLLRALSISLTARATRWWWPAPARRASTWPPTATPTWSCSTWACPASTGSRWSAASGAGARCPIIVLSARHQSVSKVEALDAGADDYVTKPFGMDELLARLRAALRRITAGERGPRVEAEGFTWTSEKRVTRDGVDVHLTPKEWDIVEVLVRNPGRLVSQRQLLHDVWGPEYETETEYLRVLMGRVRRKLEVDHSRPRTSSPSPAWATASSPDERRRSRRDRR